MIKFGDCLGLMKEIEDSSIDMVYTDIPYGINYKSNKQGQDTRTGVTLKTGRSEYFKKINNDDKIPDIEWLEESFRVLKNGAAIYICVRWDKFGELQQQVLQCGFKVKNMIVFNKSNHGMGDLKGQYAPKHELLLFATKGRHLLNFPNGRNNDVWDVPVKFSGSKRLHPNEKPLPWIVPAILNSTNIGGVVLDPYMGCGSTGQACLENKRNFIGFDNDKEYFDIAKSRLNI